MADNTQEEFEQFLQQNRIDYQSLKQANPDSEILDAKQSRINAILKAVCLSSP